MTKVPNEHVDDSGGDNYKNCVQGISRDLDTIYPGMLRHNSPKKLIFSKPAYDFILI